MAVTKRLLQLAVGLALPWCVGGKTVYDAGLYAQIPLRDITDANRAQYLADVRAAGVETVLISFLEFFEQGEARRPTLTKLAAEIGYFKKAGVPTMVWINGFGYGDDRTKTPEGRVRFKDSQVLVGVDGRSNGALCPLDPAHRAYLLEFVRDVAAAGAKFILMDDDYVQSARGRLGCVCPRHLARVSAKCGHAVTREEVCASFTGKPNAVRTAFVDTTGEVAIELAREMRATVDAVNPSVGMGLCLSYTHWDIEGADMESLLGAFAGSENGEAASCRFTTTQDPGQGVKRRDAASPLRRKVVRLSGAPYWGDRRFNGMGLEGFIECLRLQGEWTRGKGWTVFDENDPYPRKVAKVPTWRCELYDKATIADGLVARHKYMFCYGPDRAEPGYLEAHLVNLPDDARLRALFANTEPYGVYLPFPQRQIREATLPAEFVGEDRLTGLMSQPFGAVLLLRSGIPVRYTPADDAYTLDARALGIDLWNLDYLVVKPEDYRQKILDAAAGSGKPLAVHVETASRRIYQIIRYNPVEKSYSVLLENMGDTSADVKIVAKGTVKILDSLRGDFKVVPEGVALSDFPAHAWSVVKFSL